MAEKRMFTKKITDSDAFQNMPLSAQALYFHLNMAADDEGFVNNPMKIQRGIGAAIDDLNILVAKNFIIRYESGIIVIKHWKMHNYIAKDRFHKTDYTEERAMLEVKENGAYTLADNSLYTECIQIDDRDKNRLDKNSIDKNNKDICLEQAAEPPFITLPLNDKSEYPVTNQAVREYKELYPAVNVEQELRNMRGWCLSNPTKRKTKSGIGRFINSWLSKEQNKGNRNNSSFELKV